MVLRSKRESRRTRKPEISICSETGASGERTRPRVPFAAPRRELSLTLSSIQRVTFAPLIGEGANRRSPRRPLPGKLLAQTQQLSQAPMPMNSSGRSQTSARVFVAAVLFAAFSWTLLVSVSPQLHARIHSDANRTDHVCGITLVASGSYELAAQLPVISPPQFDVRFAASAELTSTWVKPLFLSAHIFAHAPPALV